MKIVQVLPTLAYGDAIGNDTRALKKVIADMGYETEIYAENVIPPLTKDDALHISKMPKLGKEDVLIYHLSIGSDLNYKVAESGGRKIAIYHNVTPPHFFCGVNELLVENLTTALEGVEYLADKFEYCLADSDFNKKELEEKGYKCPIDVLPILIPFEDYKKEPDEDIIEKYSDGKTNIVFTGRIAPNKKQEDIIRAFACYKRFFNPEARLFLVGGYGVDDIYYQKLKKYVEELEVEDVYFTGHIKFNAILAYYKIADALLCMSEHEGFCVPLVEAMFFDVPIVAYNSTAIPWTLGGSGLLLADKDPVVVAKMLDILLKDDELKEKVLNNQRERLADFEYDKIRTMFEGYIKNFLHE